MLVQGLEKGRDNQRQHGKNEIRAELTEKEGGEGEWSLAVQSSAVLPAVSVGVQVYVISCPPAVTQDRRSPL